MFIQKIYWHTLAIAKICFYRLLFGSKLQFPFSSTFRERFNLTIGGGKINIGEHVFFNNDCSLNCEGAVITVGNGTLFGENVKIYTHNHQYKDIIRPIKEQGYSCSSVTIGKHCWIGSNVTILKGVTIGDNTVIGAGCIIHKDIPSNVVVFNKQNICIKEI